MRLSELTCEDLKLYFSRSFVHTYFTAKERSDTTLPLGRWQYCYDFENALNEEGKAIVNAQFRGKNTTTNIRIRDDLFQIVFPKPGFYNYKGTVIQYARTSRRQNRKGLNSENSRFLNFMATVLKEVPDFPERLVQENHFQLNSLNLNTLFSVDDKKPSLEMIYNNIIGGQVIARALTPELIASVGVKDKSPSLWIGNSYVGRLINAHKVAIDVPPLAQEASDQLKKYAVQLTG